MSPDFYQTEIKLFDTIPCHKHLWIKLPTQEKTDEKPFSFGHKIFLFEGCAGPKVYAIKTM